MRSCDIMNLEKTNQGITSFLSSNSLILQKAEAMKKPTSQNNTNATQHDNQRLINATEIEAVVDSLNDFIDPLQTNLKFVFHEELNEYYVAVVNPLTNEVVKEIPPKKMLDMYAAMAEFMGILIDEKI